MTHPEFGCEDLCQLKVKDLSPRRGILHFRVRGKGSKIRFLLAHPRAISLIQDYLDAAGHREEGELALFQPVKNNLTLEGLHRRAILVESLEVFAQELSQTS